MIVRGKAPKDLGEKHPAMSFCLPGIPLSVIEHKYTNAYVVIII
jgi:hypothetical protein